MLYVFLRAIRRVHTGPVLLTLPSTARLWPTNNNTEHSIFCGTRPKSNNLRSQSYAQPNLKYSGDTDSSDSGIDLEASLGDEKKQKTNKQAKDLRDRPHDSSKYLEIMNDCRLPAEHAAELIRCQPSVRGTEARHGFTQGCH